ncbi:M13 family metallopeptidase [Luteibacter jiangsuensis]|uniref:M13 family metallopeptidase n=1 Tax=Luteibacter jiangsuensis TaxID=637577 RepID=A0ABX0Q894_9GAMM|nr:M13 family metallopeptidase [Luteibacter jiangsuensis]NID05867.1 M13 family metallopeptidase [Luteibacter jiangsuensis]
MQAPIIKTLVAALAFSAVPAMTANAVDVTGMDRSIRPGDDFYLYANGGWQKTAVIPPDSGVVYGDNSARKMARERMNAILAEEAEKPTSRAGTLFRSFMNESEVNRLGISPAKPALNDISGLATRDDIAEAMARYARLGVHTLFSGGPSDDDHRVGYSTLYWWSDGLGMGERGYYLADTPGGSQAAEAYAAYAEKLLFAAGIHDAHRVAKDVLAFETRLASPKPPESDEVIYDEVSVADLTRRMPGIPWARVIHAFGWPEGRRMRIDEPNVMSVRAKAFVEAPVETLRAYLLIRFLDAYAPYLSTDLSRAHFEFHDAVLLGAGAEKSRAERAVKLVQDFIPDDVEAIYAARFFSPSSKARMEALAAAIKEAFAHRLQNVTWMDEATRSRALAKLKNVIIEVGYPSTWHDYSGLTFSNSNLFDNVERANRWTWDDKLTHLDKPLDRHEWTCLYPSTVNACSDTSRLALFFPAAYLQKPIFDPAYDAADLYGRIGATIGHELTHQFDPGGSTRDENGLRNPWWPDEVRRAFVGRTDQLVAQYNGYEIAPGVRLDGKRTITENTADLGGLNIAFDAYRKALGGHDLPIVDGLAGDQRFFIAYAQARRAKFNDSRLRAQLQNVHAPGHQRAFEVRNVDAWYAAFDVQPGAALYLSPAARVRIW